MAEIFSASSQARLKVRLVTVRSAPLVLRIWAVFSPISPLPMMRILVEARLSKMRRARSHTMLLILIWPLERAVWVWIHLAVWKLFWRMRLRVELVAPNFLAFS